MKKSILFLSVLLLPIFLSAQIFNGGVLFGVAGSQIDGDEQSGYKKPGLLVGGFVKSPFNERASLLIEFYYVGKGAVFNESYADGTVYQIFKTSLHYIEMPFLFDYKLTDKFNLSVGVASAYLFADKIILNGYEVDKDSYLMSNFDFAPMGQVDFYLTDNLSTNIKFSYSVFSIRQDDFWYNNNLSISLRYKLN